MSVYAESYANNNVSGDAVTNSVTLTVTGSNAVVVLCVGGITASFVHVMPDSVTFDVLGTPRAMSFALANNRLDIYYLNGVSPGTYQIDIVYSALDVASVAIASSVVMANQTTSIGTTASSAGLDASPTVTLSSITDWGWVQGYVGAVRAGVLSFTAGSGQSTRSQLSALVPSDSSRIFLAVTDQTPSPTRVSGGTLNAIVDWEMISLEVLAANNMRVGTPVNVSVPTNVATPTQVSAPSHFPVNT